ncbi:MAG: hypothetical protein K8I27_03855 [Planctomycetes bacterium]|nr:hypothetical protein [Planctomycetota bacterium]
MTKRAISAETAYLFRHALLRDAAYEMQLPSDRAKLHELAFYLIEEAFGGRAPEPPPLDAANPGKFTQHETDAVALELAHHAGLGGTAKGDQASGFGGLRRLYLRRAAEIAVTLPRPLVHRNVSFGRFCRCSVAQ